MNVDERHLIALDHLFTMGGTVTVNGKAWDFSPNDWGDLAELIKMRKAEALSIYREQVRQENDAAIINKRPQDGIRQSEVDRMTTKILFRGATEEDFNLGDPGILTIRTFLSLRKKHPELNLAAVNQLLSNDEFRNAAVSVLDLLTFGPGAERKEGEKPDASRPFPSTSTTTSAG